MASSLGKKNSSGPPPTSSYRHSIRCCRLKIGSERKCRVSCHAEIQKNLFWRHKIRVSAAYDRMQRNKNVESQLILIWMARNGSMWQRHMRTTNILQRNVESTLFRWNYTWELVIDYEYVWYLHCIFATLDKPQMRTTRLVEDILSIHC